MAQPLIDTMLTNARTIIADRRRRLRCTEAVTASGEACDACAPTAVRFCAVGALINSAFRLTSNHEQAHRLGWKVAGMIAKLPACVPWTRVMPVGVRPYSAIRVVKARYCMLWTH